MALKYNKNDKSIARIYVSNFLGIQLEGARYYDIIQCQHLLQSMCLRNVHCSSFIVHYAKPKPKI